MFLYVVVVVGLQFPLVDVDLHFLQDQDVRAQDVEVSRIQDRWVVLCCVEDRGCSCLHCRGYHSV